MSRPGGDLKRSWHDSPASARATLLTLPGCAIAAALLSSAGCGGGPSSPTSPLAPSPPALVVYEPGNGVTSPTPVHEVRPTYTPEAIAARIQGTVLLSVVVLADGTVGEVRVVQSLDTQFGLDAAAVGAARQWLFTPGMRDARPVAVRITIQFTFSVR